MAPRHRSAESAAARGVRTDPATSTRPAPSAAAAAFNGIVRLADYEAYRTTTPQHHRLSTCWGPLFARVAGQQQGVQQPPCAGASGTCWSTRRRTSTRSSTALEQLIGGATTSTWSATCAGHLRLRQLRPSLLVDVGETMPGIGIIALQPFTARRRGSSHTRMPTTSAGDSPALVAVPTDSRPHCRRRRPTLRHTGTARFVLTFARSRRSARQRMSPCSAGRTSRSPALDHADRVPNFRSPTDQAAARSTLLLRRRSSARRPPAVGSRCRSRA